MVGNVYDILQDSFTSLIVPMITSRRIEWGTLFLNKHKLDDRLAPFYLFTFVWMTGCNDDKPTFIGYPNLIFTESFTKIASYPSDIPLRKNHEKYRNSTPWIFTFTHIWRFLNLGVPHFSSIRIGLSITPHHWGISTLRTTGDPSEITEETVSLDLYLIRKLAKLHVEKDSVCGKRRSKESKNRRSQEFGLGHCFIIFCYVMWDMNIKGYVLYVFQSELNLQPGDTWRIMQHTQICVMRL